MQIVIEQAYKVKITKLKKSEGGGYTVCLPELGEHSFVGDGETKDDAIISLREQAKWNFKDYARRNRLGIDRVLGVGKLMSIRICDGTR